jgi:beta-lactam-binding protein with PASTA domain
LHCVVPKVVGKKLKAARSAIVRAHCRVGKVKKRYSRRVRKGRVLAQSPKAHRRLARNTKVNLVVSRGRKPHRARQR